MARKAAVYTIAGKKSGTVELPALIVSGKINQTLLAQAVRVYLSNQRRGLAKTKRRGELVSISTAKVWRQKGTGRARHGSRRAPIFVGGGKAHGPTGTQNYRLRLPKKMKQAALAHALRFKYKEEQIQIVTGLEKLKGKTKAAVVALDHITGNTRRPTVVAVARKTPDVIRALRNVPYVKVRSVAELTTYDVLWAKSIIFTKKGLNQLTKRVATKKSKRA